MMQLLYRDPAFQTDEKIRSEEGGRIDVWVQTTGDESRFDSPWKGILFPGRKYFHTKMTNPSETPSSGGSPG
jgi:hypothetical protein